MSESSGYPAHPHPNPLPKGEGTKITSIVAIFIVLVCCALPMGWIVFEILMNPTTLRELHLDSFRMALLGRTVFYSLMVGVIAVVLALPAAWVIGRGRGAVASSLGFVLPIS